MMSPLRALLAALLLACGGSAPLSAGADDGMAALPAGSYLPFYTRESAKVLRRPSATKKTVAVAAFRLDRYPVSNGEYLGFVRRHPEWRRSRIAALFADAHYLSHWAGDVALRDADDAARPVTNVSWFAAGAYCKAQGKTLPTTDQWEYALADGGRDAAARKTAILAWYGVPATHALEPARAAVANGYGVHGLIGLVWEWTRDFNSLMSGADLRGSNSQFCGGGSLGATDATDYAAFMRYSMRASLQASYTTRNLGFRCASNAN
jgi:formylglycine-generating enzyme required for sulfatase activity